MEPYQYRPLDASKQEIRIVELAPGQSSSPLLHFTLKHVSLLETPRYWTLSYTWGSPFDGLEPEWDDPTAKRLICADGQSLYVRWNLEAALRSQAYYEVPSLWIDAICIDQANVAEKTQQVQMMGQIYKSAVMTLAWLGPSSDDSSRAISAISRFRHSWDTRPHRLKRQNLTPSDLEVYRVYAQDDLGYDTAVEDIRAIAQILKRSWFRRVWIVQEVSLSKEVILSWGEGGLSYWGWLGSAVLLFAQHFHSIFMIKDPQANMQCLLDALQDILSTATWFRRIDDLRRLTQNNDYVGPIMVLESLRSFKASDNRDHVYAGLSMSPDLGTIKVDYNVSEAAVLRIATRTIIERNNDLSILALRFPSDMDNIPSWAVDFTKSGGASLSSYQIINSWERLYRAGGNFCPDVVFKNASIMAISGVPLGVLSYVGSITARQCMLGENTIDIAQLLQSKEFGNVSALQEAWLGGWLSQHPEEDSGKYMWTDEDICKAFARTICCDAISPDNVISSRLGPTFDFTAEDSWRQLFRSNMVYILAQQTFAVTSLGHFCMVQEDAQAGDVIFVATGAETPYLLRPMNDGRYKFVGCSYVHGFMDGEAVEWMKTSEGDIQGIMFEVT